MVLPPDIDYGDEPGEVLEDFGRLRIVVFGTHPPARETRAPHFARVL
jgi:hypothetical protein